MSRISASVGQGGENRPDDVRTIQKLLNEQSLPPQRALEVDGHAGERTIEAIRHFQSSKVGLKNPDGRVDSRGKTLQMLLDGPGRGDKPAEGGGAAEEESKAPKEAREDRKRRNEFVGGSVREKESTTRIIDALEPHFRGVRARVISAYLNDTDLFWKVNYHWELLLWMVDHSLTLNITPAHRKSLSSIKSSLNAVKPEPDVGYRESAILGRPADRSTLEQFDERYKVLRSAKQNFKKIMTDAGLSALSKREEKAFDLAAAPVAHPGTSKHSTGYALDIEGDNSRINAITKQLGATLVFDEKSHVHVEFKNGVRSN
jgi:peptidoglycan hydrolase-like protein with peptidoglycan-binding domain